MLKKAKAVATIAVKDLAIAKRFYEGVLGLEPSRDQEPGTLSYKNGDGFIFVYPSKFAGTNKATALTWLVSDVDGIARELRAKGVPFEHYDDLPDTKREGDIHIARNLRVAWFKDPDGNIHSLVTEQ